MSLQDMCLKVIKSCCYALHSGEQRFWSLHMYEFLFINIMLENLLYQYASLPIERYFGHLHIYLLEKIINNHYHLKLSLSLSS